ncbi:hypothetical protein JOB18_026243 [Solea senegalensis]|uniref:Uncharacterized protein n=1 Tax=Solea senegalensis TaxID=28829 RepID=A0AAV6SGM9_SOLSE|nr:hypothetical protein JOB18_026243 [Solea senegalensis]
MGVASWSPLPLLYLHTCNQSANQHLRPLQYTVRGSATRPLASHTQSSPWVLFRASLQILSCLSVHPPPLHLIFTQLNPAPQTGFIRPFAALLHRTDIFRMEITGLLIKQVTVWHIRTSPRNKSTDTNHLRGASRSRHTPFPPGRECFFKHWFHGRRVADHGYSCGSSPMGKNAAMIRSPSSNSSSDDFGMSKEAFTTWADTASALLPKAQVNECENDPLVMKKKHQDATDRMPNPMSKNNTDNLIQHLINRENRYQTGSCVDTCAVTDEEIQLFKIEKLPLRFSVCCYSALHYYSSWVLSR